MENPYKISWQNEMESMKALGWDEGYKARLKEERMVGVDCPFKNNCTDYGTGKCANCKHNLKRSFYEPVEPPYYPIYPYPYYPYYPTTWYTTSENNP